MPTPSVENPAAVFVEIMRKERERRGLAPDKLAVSIGFMPHVIKEWESGGHTPRLGSAIRWAEALGFQFELVRERE